MNYKVVFLHQAEQELIALKKYITQNFATMTWQEIYQAIKNSIEVLTTFPRASSMLPELATLNLSQYRQIISDMNRIIYEIRE